MKPLVYICIFVGLCLIFTSCSSLKEVGAGYSDAAKGAYEVTKDSSKLVVGAHVLAISRNFEGVGMYRMTIRGMRPGTTLIWKKKDLSKEERSIGKDGEESLLVPAKTLIWVNYIYGQYGRGKAFTLASQCDWRWNPSLEKFEKEICDE